jgi:hypothetical protein
MSKAGIIPVYRFMCTGKQSQNSLSASRLVPQDPKNLDTRHRKRFTEAGRIEAGFNFRHKALFRRLLLDPVAALCNGNDPDWRRDICGAEQRYIGLVIGEILIDAPERVLG